ncbi:MAG: ZIP family metal transporter [Candidatus Omnitrophica bacterium]|nr:ZIP family metal transporter [Candidatus Omnitrophota bacterium]
MNLILLGTFASVVAGSATIVGALVVFFMHRVSDKFLDTSLGFAAGVMLAATFFGLVTPAVALGGIWRASAGILLGMLFFIMMERAVPHIHRVAGVKGPVTHLSKATLFMLAMTIHNFPEGLSVGVGFARADIRAGIILAVGIGIQNLVEGMATSLTLLKDRSRAMQAFLIASFTAIVEPVGGLFGISVLSVSQYLLPYGLAFAAGAMLFVTSEELIPETHSRGNAREATMGLIFGFITMMILEKLFV